MVEGQQAIWDAGASGYRAFQQTIALERVVEHKTRALEEKVRELGEAQAQLLHAQKLEAVGQLAAGIAHEINTPMQYIGDNTRFLKKAFDKILALVETLLQMRDTNDVNEDPNTSAALHEAMRAARIDFIRERVPRALTQSIEGVEAVSRIVAAMKEFSHPGAEQKQPVDLNHLLETTKTVSRNEWKYVATVELDFEAHLPSVPGLASELNQVFLNLIVNAAHAISDTHQDEGTTGIITLRTRSSAHEVEVHITDSGCGIPPAIQARIFDPFFTTKEVGKGTGQGLAIARSIIVDKHQGCIEVTSTPGQGTTFLIRLPRHHPKDEA
ncbi:MAG: sensor histidine kinase [Polyangiales bacterium]